MREGLFWLDDLQWSSDKRLFAGPEAARATAG